MKKVALLLTLAVLVTPLLTACGEKQAQETEVTFAGAIEDGAEKYAPNQFACPVCDQRGLQGAYHVELDGKRVYFDSQDCADKFEQNPDKYMENLKRQTMEGAMPGPDMRQR